MTPARGTTVRTGTFGEVAAATMASLTRSLHEPPSRCEGARPWSTALSSVVLSSRYTTSIELNTCVHEWQFE